MQAFTRAIAAADRSPPVTRVGDSPAPFAAMLTAAT
jgi:hypothetical protein